MKFKPFLLEIQVDHGYEMDGFIIIIRSILQLTLDSTSMSSLSSSLPPKAFDSDVLK
jgi:hypothetical protein